MLGAAEETFEEESEGDEGVDDEGGGTMGCRATPSRLRLCISAVMRSSLMNCFVVGSYDHDSSCLVLDIDLFPKNLVLL